MEFYCFDVSAQHKHWFVESAMDALLQADFAVAGKDRLYRCPDRIVEHKQELFVHLKQKWAELFAADFEVLLYDLTSTYFEGRWKSAARQSEATVATAGLTACRW